MKGQRIAFLIWWLCLILLFWFSGAAATFWALGYRFNRQTWQIQRTGLIILKSDPKDATVTLNGQMIEGKTPIRIPHLLPGLYELEVNKNGYIPWKKLARVDPNQAIEFRNILLFRSISITLDVTQADQRSIDTHAPHRDVSVIGSEIWFKTELVTRTFSTVLQADLWPDGHHILYQKDNEFRVIELDGGNDTLLATVLTLGRVPFAFSDGGRIFLYNDNGELKKLQIR